MADPLDDEYEPLDDPAEDREAPPPMGRDDYGVAISRQPPKAPLITASPFVWRDPALIPPRKWLYGSHLIRKFVSTTIAPGGVGKTALGLAEALAMVTGRDLLRNGHRGEPLRVWVYNLEDPLEELERRVAAICLHFGIGPGDIGGRLFLDSGRNQELIVARSLKDSVVVVQPVVEALVTAMCERTIDVLIVDPFVSCHTVKENDNGAIDKVAKTFAGIADRTDAAVELIHHARKTNGAEVTVEDGRGAVALLAASRSGRVLNVMTKDEGKTADVGNHRSYFRADDGKPNLAPPADKASWFRFVSIALGNGDNVGVVEPWQYPDAFDGVTVSSLRAAQEAVSNGRWRENSQATDWVGIPIANALGLDPTNEAHKGKIKKLLKTWTANGMFVVVEGLDEKSRPRPFVKVGKLANG